MFLPNIASTNFSRPRDQEEFMRVQKEFRRCSAPSIVLSTGPGEDRMRTGKSTVPKQERTKLNETGK
jgi:hypothetical protein